MRSDADNEPHSLGEVEVVAETDKAIKVTSSDDASDSFWVPKSVVHEDSEVEGKGDSGELFVRYWWAEKSDRT